jgi:hypothetical protein
MNLFQAVGITLVGLLLVVSVREGVKRPRAATWAWVLLLVSGLVLLAWPDLSFELAAVFGIQRGADLVLYTAVLAGVLGFFLLYLRLRWMEHQVTVLVRELALRSPSLPGPGPRSPGARDARRA